jgi:hypothetical protein
MEVQSREINAMTGVTGGLVIQQAGLNAGAPGSTGHYVRVMLETLGEGRRGELRTAGTAFTYDKDELSTLDAAFREQAKSPGITFLTWEGASNARLHGMSAAKVTYTRRYGNNDPAKVTVYSIENSDCVVKITLSYRMTETALWAADLDAMLDSFIVTVR